LKVEWGDEATESLNDIKERLARFSEATARKVADAIVQRTLQLEDFPFSGRTVPEYDVLRIRELLERGYRILYQVLDDRVEILAVVPAAFDLDPTHEP
jgi:plasmid stabilization system protein ParE